MGGDWGCSAGALLASVLIGTRFRFNGIALWLGRGSGGLGVFCHFLSLPSL